MYVGMCAYLEVTGLCLEFLDLFMKVKYAQMPRREEIHKFLYNSPKSLDVLTNG